MSRSRRRPRKPPPLEAWDRLYPTLDLHGLTAAEARARAERWLRARQSEAEPVVRIVTGWGRHSVGPPVLRAEIDALLGSLRGGLVANHTLESGGGAFRVELRRARRAAPAGPASAATGGRAPGPALPPDLRRQAEDSLWELGITPTPELVRAEIERLRRAGPSGEA
jgi:hypothetical protein